MSGEEAEHARRVKRLRPGDAVLLLNGRGLVARAEVVEAKREFRARVLAERVEAPLAPAVEVWSATPKGARLDDMLDGLTQVGAAAWRPMHTARGVVDPRDSKLARMDRVVREACKQSGRAWLMRLDAPAAFEDALRVAREGPATVVVLADASGGPLERFDAESARLLIGPEGGFTHEEIDAARAAGAGVVTLGAHAMRIETAAVVGAAMTIDAGRR